MNKVYKVIWSKVRHCYVVVSELAKSTAKAPKSGVFSRAFVVGVLACVFTFGAVIPVFAEGNPGVGVNGVSDQSMNHDGGGALGYDAIAIGDAKSAGSASISIGAGTLVTGQNSIAIGTNAMASGDGATREIVDRLLRNNKEIREGLDTARSEYTASNNAYNLQLEKFNKTSEALARVNYANELIAGYQAEIDNTLQPNLVNATAAYNTAKSDYETLLGTLTEHLNAIKSIDFTAYTGDGGIVDTNLVAADLKTATEQGTDFDYPLTFYKQYVDAYIDFEGNARMFNETASILSPTKTVNTNKNYTEYFFNANNDWNILIKYLNGNSQGQQALAGDQFLSAAGLKNADCPSDAFLFAVFKGYLKVDNKTHEVLEINTYAHGGVNGASNGTGDGLNVAYVPRSNNHELLDLCRSQTLDDETYQSKVAALNASFDAVEARNQYYMIGMRDSGVFNAEEKEAFNSDLVTYKAIDDARKQMVLNIYGYAHAGYQYEQAVAQYGENSAEALNALTQKTTYKQGILNALSVNDTTKDMIFTYGNTNITNDDVFKLLGGGLLSPVTGDYATVRTDNAGNKYTNYNYRHYLEYYPTEETTSTGLVRRYMINWYKEKIVDRENLVKYTLEDLSASMDDFISDKRDIYNDATVAKTVAETALADKQAQIRATTPSAQDVADANVAAAAETTLNQRAAQLEADRVALEAAKAALDNLQSIEESGQGAIAIGNTAITTGKDAVGIGTDSISTGEEAVALGKQNIVAAKQAIGLGSANSVSGEVSLAIGHNNGVTGVQSLAVGTGHVVTGSHSGAIGDPNIVNGDNSYVVGNNSFVAESSTDMFVLGNNVNAFGNNSVVLGTYSSGSQNNVVSVGHKATDLDVNGQQYGSALNRRIVNVANGVDANDAVNVSQLNATVDGLGNRLKLAGIGINGVGSQSMNYDGGGAIGYDSVAIGDAKSAGSASISIGAGALVTGQNSIAIGTNSMASGDGATRQQVDQLLSNNRAIREGLDAARSTFTASENAYNLSLERFNKTNEAVARVQAANQIVAGYQAEIDNTYQPAADTANANYQAAKSAYDALDATLQERLTAIKYIDFTDYSTGNVVDTNAVAAQLKSQTEEGTSFDYPQQFYKAYVDAYIESEGNGRETFLKAQQLSPSSKYSNNNTVQTISFYTNDIRTNNSYVADPFFKAIGWEKSDVPDGAFDPINFGASFSVDVNTGELLSQDITSYWIPFWYNTSPNSGTKIAISSVALPNYYSYTKTATLDDAAYTAALAEVDSRVDSKISSLENTFGAMINSGVFTPEESQMALDAQNFCIAYENNRRNLVKNILAYSHEQYLYEKYKAEEGENSSNALLHLSKCGEYKQAVTDVLGESQAEKLFTPGDSTEMYFQGKALFSSSAYVEMTGSTALHGDGFGFVPSVNNRLVQWYKENVLDSQNLVKYSLNQLKGSMTDFLSDMQTAYDEATAAKTAADNALNAKRQQLAQASPSQADIDAANAAQASASELQQKADKLDADRTALEAAKASLDELQSIEEAGRGAIAIGDTAVTTGEDAIGMGTNVIVTGANAIALGKENIVSGDRALALGTSNSVSEDQSIAIGTGNGITGESSIAIGNDNIISGNNSIAIGYSLNVTEDNVVSIGNRKMTNVAKGTADTDAVNVKQLNDALSEIDLDIDVDGEVASGNTGLISGGMVFNETRLAQNGNYVQASKTASENLGILDTALKSLDTSVFKYDNAEHSVATLDGANGTKLTNLRVAELSADSTDAVTGAQLYATNQNITGFATDINRNKANIAQLNTSISAALSSVATSGELVNTLDDLKADASLNNLTNAGRQVIASAAANAVQEYFASQQNVSSMAPLMAGNANTLSITDAGNGSLHVGEGSSVSGSSSIAIGVGNQVNANNSGAFGDPSIIDADDSYVLGNDDRITSVAKGSFIVGNNSKADAEGSLLFGSNSTSNGNNGLALGNNTVVTATNSVALGSSSDAMEENVVSVGNATLKRKIVNVADGDISKGSTDAVTGNQLFITNEKVKKNASDIALKANIDASNIDIQKWSQALGNGTVSDGDEGLVTGGTVHEALSAVTMGIMNSSLTKTDGENIYIGPEMGGNVISVYNNNGEARAITGVATNPNDKTSAANVGYVDAVGQSLMNNVNQQFGEVNTRVNKIGANAAALSALTPATFEGDERWSLAASVGHYKSQTSSAIGAFYKPTENVMMNVRGALGNGENMLAAGVSVSLNKGDIPGVTKRQLATKVNQQEGTIYQLRTEMSDMKQHYEQRLSSYEHELMQLKQVVDTLSNAEKK